MHHLSEHWHSVADETLLQAAKEINTYTEAAAEIIRVEIRARGLVVPPPELTIEPPEKQSSIDILFPPAPLISPLHVVCKSCGIQFNKPSKRNSHVVLSSITGVLLIVFFYALYLATAPAGRYDNTGDKCLGGCLLIVSIPTVIIMGIITFVVYLRNYSKNAAQVFCPNCNQVYSETINSPGQS